MKTATIIRGLGWTFIWVGIYLLGFVGYQLFVTDFLTARAQEELEGDLRQYFVEAADAEPQVAILDEDTGQVVEVAEVEDLPPVDPVDPDPIEVPSVIQWETVVAEGDAFAQIRIPEIEVDVTVVEGVRRRDLKKGPGHMGGTPLPGQPGNAVISGHRTTYGAPFHNLDELEEGDIIEIESSIGTHTYEVRGTPFTVEPTEIWVTDPDAYLRRVPELDPEQVGPAWLTLTTCHPKFSARERLIVHAELIDGPNAPVILGV